MTQCWLNSRYVLEKLVKQLSCPICCLPMSEPYVLKSCNHHFCRKCAEFSLAEHQAKCPVCTLPAWASDVHADRLLGTVAKNMLSMETIMKSDTNGLDTTSTVENCRKGHSIQIQRKIKPRSKVHDSQMPSTSAVPSPSLKSRQRNVRGETPLHIAAIKGNVGAVQDLLEKGVNPNTRDFAGWTPLHESCIHGHESVGALLLKHGAIVNSSGYDGDTPLHDAVGNGHIQVTRLLLSRGADPKIRNVHGQVAGDFATTEVLKNLLLHQNCIHSLSSCETRKLVWLGTGLQQWQKTQLTDVAKEVGACVVDSFSPKITHLITVANQSKCCPRTLKYLYAVAKGKWIVTFQWIARCQQEKQIVDEGPYEIVGTVLDDRNFITYAPRRGRDNAMREGQDLFGAYKFYFSGDYSRSHPSKDDLEELVKVAGGTVLAEDPQRDPQRSSNTNSNFVLLVTNISKVRYSCPFIKLSPSWIIECLSQFKVLL